MPTQQQQRILDDLQIFCPQARSQYELSLVASHPGAEVFRLTQALVILAECLKEHDKALQSLTPGGSEYVNDRMRCVAYIREVTNAHRRRAEEAMHKLKELERRLEGR